MATLAGIEVFLRFLSALLPPACRLTIVVTPLQIWRVRLTSGHFQPTGVSRRSFICSTWQQIRAVRLLLEDPIASLGGQEEFTTSVRLASAGSPAVGGKLMVARALYDLHVVCKSIIK